ncbi:MAG: ABC transporter substrate-binding protein [Candidatus Rokubacteria bacterium]|nr:ABC transporter substrate-binding protein [Candidatus Rokubacteria bacterium]
MRERGPLLRADQLSAVRLAAVAVALAAGIASLAAPAPARAQGARVSRIGVLSPFIGPDSLFFETLRRRLQELGYVEGRNIAFVYRAAEDFDQLQTHAREMVRLNVDVIATAGPQGVRAARGATATIPIVMGNVGDALDQGFITSFAKPGGNVTGLSSLNSELSAKRLALLKEALPRLTRVAVLREAVGDATPLRTAESVARTLGITLEVFQVRDADELPSAFASMAAARVGAVEVLPSPLFVSQLRRVVELAAVSRVPAIYPDDRFVHAGGLMSYGSRIPELYARAAEYVDRILKGARPGDLPVEQPTTFTLAVNLRIARELGVTLPQGLLIRADHVVR